MNTYQAPLSGLKILSAFYWLSFLEMPSSLKWIVKLDDDIIVNVTKLDEYLSEGNIDQEAIHCQIKSPKGIIHKFS